MDTESENDDENFASDNEMDDQSQDTNQSFEQTEIKRRKNCNMFEDEFPPLMTPISNDKHTFATRC